MDVKYKVMPVIRGEFKIYNYGSCKFGDYLTFNSAFRANPAGLTKTCSVFVEKNGKLSIGNNCGFSGVSIYCINEIIIGNHLLCGANVNIWDTDFHSLNYLERRVDNNDLVKTAPVVIGNDVFIGANSTILKGVVIGDNCIIGAGSVITKNIPANEIWAGNPAKFIRCINS